MTLPEREIEPSHVGGISALPKIDDALEILLLLLLLLVILLALSFGGRFLGGHPVATEEHVTIGWKKQLKV